MSSPWYIRIYRGFTRAARFWWQKLTRGFSDDETWNLDVAIAKFIIPRLKRFREISYAYPHDLTPEIWDCMLRDMIAGFEWFASDVGERDEDGYLEARDNVKMFAEYFGALWW